MSDKPRDSEENPEHPASAETNESASTDSSALEPPTRESISAWAREWLLSLFDLGFQRSMVLHALPALYVVMIGGGAIYMLYVVGAAFTVSIGKGLIWVFLGPVVYLVGLSLVRAVLEFFAAVLQIAVRVESMRGNMEEITAVPKWLRSLNPLAGKDDA